MKLNKVTITGADNSIKPEELNKLSVKYPYVEWAILLSKKSEGKKRFPTIKWIEELKECQNNLQLSGHLCGKFVREILIGFPSFINERSTIYDIFQRFQLNFQAEELEYGTYSFMNAVKQLSRGREIIFQQDGKNNNIILPFIKQKLNVSALHDVSHGAGVLPSDWPKLIQNIPNGYAGGLSPKNVKEQCYKIAEIIGDSTIWIDVETKIRSNNDQQFDLEKVEEFLENTKEFIK